jgi:hypothetical protein
LGDNFPLPRPPVEDLPRLAELLRTAFQEGLHPEVYGGFSNIIYDLGAHLNPQHSVDTSPQMNIFYGICLPGMQKVSELESNTVIIKLNTFHMQL